MVLYIAPIANIAVRCLPRLALACDPQLFLFDEPMSNLDAKLRVEMRAEIKCLHHVSGITRVYVPHDQIEAMTLGSRIAVMKDGVL